MTLQERDDLNREEGIQIGKNLGKEEKSIEIAKNLIGLLPLDTISEKTGVSMEQLKVLEKEVNSKN